MIRIITFDLDDTLWDVRPALVKAEQAQNAWLTEHYPDALEGLDKHALNERKRNLITRQPELIHHISQFRQQFLQELLLEAGVPAPEALDAAQNAFQAFIAKRNDVALFEHAEAVLEQLHKRYVLAALTNGNADVTRTPLARFFEFAIKAEDVGAAKPEPDLFLAALERSGSRPEEAVHVGDSHAHDIVGARNAGVRSIWLRPESTESEHADALAECEPDAQIACLTEIPQWLARWSQ